jgi:serine protease AprX
MAWQLPGIPARPSSPLSPLRSCCALLALLALLVPFLPAAAGAGPAPGRGPASVGRSGQQGGEAAPGGMLSLIVRERDPASTQAEHLVAQAGGIVTRALPIIGGFAARVPAEHLSPLLGSPAVQRVWPDGPMRVRGLDRAGPAGAGPAGAGPGTHDSLPAETVWRTAIGLDRVGPGRHPATVALLDTGVTTTPDLGHRVLARVDLTEEHDGLDRYGHGTHLAGVIAGNGELADGRAGGARGGGYQGAAPGARLVSVKVASGNGATDVSVVLAGLQWVVSNRARFGIRVLNLSFGTDSTQSYLVDPLDFAVERVWQAGILAVVAAGNDGELGSPSVRKPGDDPFVLTVGAADLNNTSTTSDDTVAPFSSRGSTTAGVGKPDLVAPGVSIVGLRAPGSTIDRFRPAARDHGHYLKGTGTSQATAVVSGVAALLYEHDPGLRPDVAKAALLDTAQRHLADQPGAGAGLVDAAAAAAAVARGTYRSRPANQGLRPSDGRGSLQASRGTLRAYTDLDGDGTPEPVAGEVDALGRTWDAAPWTATPWTPATWSASPWSRLVAESPGRGTERWGGDTWSGLGHDARTWYIKHWGGLAEDPAAWHIKHWGIKHRGILADRPGPGSVKHWGAERWS